MQLQCRCCRSLALCNPGQIRSVEQSERVRLKNILRGRSLGCTGCQLICESLPLLNGYYVESDDLSKLFVSAQIHEADDGHEEAYWSLTFVEAFDQIKTWKWIGEFELCKTTSKHDF